MRALDLDGEIDENRHLSVEIPADTPAGPVRVLVLIPESGDDGAGLAWAPAIAREWRDELEDARQDIYSLSDGEPILAGR